MNKHEVNNHVSLWMLRAADICSIFYIYIHINNLYTYLYKILQTELQYSRHEWQIKSNGVS